MQKFSFLAIKQHFAAVFISLPCLSACLDSTKLPKPPLLFPFDTQKAGFKIEVDMRIVDCHGYEFGFMLGFSVYRLIGAAVKAFMGNGRPADPTFA